MYFTSVQDLVAALHRTGCTSRAGLDVIAEVWGTKRLDEETHWQEAVALNRGVMTALDGIGVAHPEATTQDADHVIDRWPFPMGAIDLEEIEVPPSELEVERARHGP
jgi:hypothetical protein